MQTVSVGRSAIPLSVIGFGTGGLLRIPARRRQDALAAALSSGITHFDTAPIYGLGESERALGQFLRGRRERVTLTTKFGLQVTQNTARLAAFQQVARTIISMAPGLRRVLARRSAGLYKPPDFTVATVRDSLERSLRALGTDHVDLFLAHECSASALPGPELIGVLEDLRRAGKIREFGVASSFERTCEVLPACPQLAHVAQFESDAFDSHVDAARTLAARSMITHGALAHSAERLHTLLVSQPALAQRFVARAGIDLRDLALAGPVLLRAAVLANPQGVVLMQSRSIARIEANARAATSTSFDEPAQLLRALLRDASAAK